MGKNTKGGKKHKKYKNNSQPSRTRDLILADKNNGSQQYFTITKMLGDGRCLGNSSDGRNDVLCIIRGSMRKKIWIKNGDKVLGCFRDFSNKPVADIIHKYNDEEIRILTKKHSILFVRKQNYIEEFSDDDNDIGFTFDDL